MLERGTVRSVFQPIVDLDTNEVVAVEALTRGPGGSAIENPERLFAVAASGGVTAELDELCMRTAIHGAASIDPRTLLFVNVEPTSLTTALIDRTGPIAAAGQRQIVLEVTERALAGSPAELIAGVAAARERGWRVALDDVGVAAESLALLPILRPDVVKLDMGLIRDRPSRELGRTMAAVMAYAERSGALILAEGIESDEHLDRAVSLGARWGQGYRLGRPSTVDLLPSTGGPARPVGVESTPRPVRLSPYDAVVQNSEQAPRVGRKGVLLQISHHLEEQALSEPGGPLLMSAFQDAAHFTRDTRQRYSLLAEHCTLVAAIGHGMPAEPAPGVRGGVIHDGDPLAGEWTVAVLGVHYSGALLATDLGDTSVPEHDRRFSYVVTHDRHLVELAVESLLRRVRSIR